jgi:hypothetical protein
LLPTNGEPYLVLVTHLVAKCGRQCSLLGTSGLII